MRNLLRRWLGISQLEERCDFLYKLLHAKSTESTETQQLADWINELATAVPGSPKHTAYRKRLEKFGYRYGE